VCILDLDYHHGDGTQLIFRDDPSVFTVSLHIDPRLDYPGFTGFARDNAVQNLNVPLPAGTNGDAYAEALRDTLDEVEAFAPACIVVAFGADTLAEDPDTSDTGGMALLPADFSGIGLDVGRVSLRARAPILVTQEGGYSETGIPESVENLLRGIAAGLEESR
jgi:acetoin utilization deacetylase AcuC-like enzyme